MGDRVPVNFRSREYQTGFREVHGGLGLGQGIFLIFSLKHTCTVK